MNTNLRTKEKNDFQNDFFKLQNIEVFGKTLETVSIHVDVELVTTERRRKSSLSEQNCHEEKQISKNSLAIKIKEI